MKNKEISSIKKEQKTRSIIGITIIVVSSLMMTFPLILMMEDVVQELILAGLGFLLMIFGVLVIISSPIINRCGRCGENYGYYFGHDHHYDNNEDHPEDECLRNLSRKLKSL